MSTVSSLSKSDIRIRNNKIRREKELLRHIFIFIISLIIFFMIIIIWGNSKSVASEGNEQVLYKYYTSIEVHPGDTLYDISLNYVKEGKLTSKDFIDEVVYMNNLKSSDSIIAGKHILIPYYDVYHG